MRLIVIQIFCVVLMLLFGDKTIYSQQTSDTLQEKILAEIVIRAFDQNKKLKDVPAAVNFVGRSALDRNGTNSIVQAINATPGVRMEERSPGSYRFNIRGSALRSPFGVRNVKVYYNDIPITDPGGNTYLNQLGYYNFNSIEVIKGPGSSLYGAGTGGVLLIESLNDKVLAGVFSEYTSGSFGTINLYASATTGSEKLVSQIGLQHQISDGYRDHADLKRNVLTWTGHFTFNEKKMLQASFLYGDLFYKTPGALTKTEFENNSRSARPRSNGFPGAAEAQASIHQKTFIAGTSYRQQLSSKWKHESVFYGMFTELKNPTIRNYGRNSEPHVGGRSQFQLIQKTDKIVFQFNAGGEWQEGFGSVSIYKNAGGKPDSLRTFDEINNRQRFIFSQASIDLQKWTFIAGGSLNWLSIKFQRFMPGTTGKQSRKFQRNLSPRLAIMKKFKSFNIYSSISKGFSPPTTSELLPTGGAINIGLNEEKGTNYDLGGKGNFHLLNFDINIFQFSLQQTIVQRRDISGGDFFVNAGKTSQHGIESYFSYPLFHQSKNIGRSLVWMSHTWHDFHYKDFKQLNSDFSGNQIPGVSSQILAAGIDLTTIKGLLGNLNWYYGGKVFLNDANTSSAASYHLVGAKAGFQKWIKEKWRIKVLVGADNLLNQLYSLGNDINGFGGRFYNAAPRRNYYVSVSIQWISKKE